MVFTNQFLASTKASAGKALTKQELAIAREQARAAWDRFDDKTAHLELYQAWREQPVAPRAVEEELYQPLWGGGCKACPVSATELSDNITKEGWPKDEEVYWDKPAQAREVSEVDWESSSGYDCWGCQRSSLAVCHEVNAGRAFALVRQGLCNYLDFLPRAESESGAVMLIIEGAPRDGDDAVRRRVYSISGTFWSPRVSEAVNNEFRGLAQATAEELQVPCDVCLCRRSSGISERFQCIADEASGNIALELAKGFNNLELYRADYEVLLDEGTLNLGSHHRCASSGSSPSSRDGKTTLRRRAGREEARRPTRPRPSTSTGRSSRSWARTGKAWHERTRSWSRTRWSWARARARARPTRTASRWPSRGRIAWRSCTAGSRGSPPCYRWRGHGD